MNDATPIEVDAQPLQVRRGRRSVRTPENAAAIAAGLGRGIPLQYVCAAVGISKATVCEWRNSDQDFEAQIESAIAKGIESRMAIIDAAALKDWRAAAWLLQVSQPEHFARNKTGAQHQHLHVSGDKVLIYLPEKGPHANQITNGNS